MASTRLLQIVSFVNVAPAATVPLPHNININGIPKKPDYVAADASGFTIVVTDTMVTVTNTNAVQTSVDIYLELKHTEERVLGNGVQNLSPQPFIAASGASGGSPTIIVEDEGVAIPGNPFTNLNFTGGGITASNGGGGTADITVPAAPTPAITVQDEGVALPGTYTALNFTGAGVTAADAGGGVASVTIPGGGGAAAVIFDDSVPAAEVNIRSDRASNQSPIDNTKAGITNFGSATGGVPSTGVTGNYGTLGGGDDNSAAGDWATIAGGRRNVTTEFADAIGGGSQNQISGTGANVIGGGDSNTITNADAFANVIAGGDTNENAGEYASVIGGGNSHYNGGDECVIGGGDGNFIDDGLYAVVIAGGGNNQVYNDDAFIGAGEDNTIRGFADSIVGGGSNNIESLADFSVICGGDNNGIGQNGGDSDNAFIGAGRQNRVDGDFSSIVGGANHSINNLLNGATHSVISGGEGNKINNGNYNAIAGGQRAEIKGFHHVIGGGRDNFIDGASVAYSGIVGGDNNTITDASYASIPGGRDNNVNEDYGSALGYANEVSVGAFYGIALGALAKARFESALNFSSADENFALPGRHQVGWIIGRKNNFTPGGAGITTTLDFGQTYNALGLEDNKVYTFRVRAVCTGKNPAGSPGDQVVTIVTEFNVKCLAGVATIVATSATDVFGTATAVANWTVAGAVAGANLQINFSTNADAATTNIFVTAHLEFTECVTN